MAVPWSYHIRYSPELYPKQEMEVSLLVLINIICLSSFFVETTKSTIYNKKHINGQKMNSWITAEPLSRNSEFKWSTIFITYPEASLCSRSAPQASNSLMQSREPPLAAKRRGVLPGKLQSTNHQARNNKTNTKQVCKSTAYEKHYLYRPVGEQTRAPLSNNIWTHRGRLWRAAKCNGVAPLLSLMFTKWE